MTPLARQAAMHTIHTVGHLKMFSVMYVPPGHVAEAQQGLIPLWDPVHSISHLICHHTCMNLKTDVCMHMQHDEVGFKRKAKKSLTSALTERVPPLLAPMTASHAEALRRSALHPMASVSLHGLCPEPNIFSIANAHSHV